MVYIQSYVLVSLSCLLSPVSCPWMFLSEYSYRRRHWHLYHRNKTCQHLAENSLETCVLQPERGGRKRGELGRENQEFSLTRILGRICLVVAMSEEHKKNNVPSPYNFFKGLLALTSLPPSLLLSLKTVHNFQK